MGDFQSKIANVKEEIEKKLMHPYIYQHIETPILDEDKLLLLVSILDQLGLTHDELVNYSVTTTLLQVALDTHEQKSISSSNSELLKHRQLTVLAGVYYSGLYYKLLADCDDVQAIRMLAQGIKTINDKKIIVYQKDFAEVEALMANVKVIESTLIDQFTDHFHMDIWRDVVTNFLFIKRLLREKEEFLKEKSSVIFEGLHSLIFPRHDASLKDLTIEQQNYLIHICDRYIEFSKQLLEKARNKLPRINELLDSRISTIMTHKPMAKTFVEEG